MSQRELRFEKGEYYHVYNRGCNKEDIFRDKENYVYLLRLMEKGLETYDATLAAYCLMPNHYHLLLRQDSETPISEFIQDIFNRYVKGFNAWCGRSGTLFEERFKAKHIDNEDYLMHLCRYIHLNPLRAGLVKSIEDWGFSDYLEWIGKRPIRFADPGIIRASFRTPEAYVRFVMDHAASKEFELTHRNYLLD
ncbi:MAG: transposase [Ignavibacteria bacterium]|nr:transposase [Ignavibacteria bacterium]